MAEYSRFKVGGVQFPLPTGSANSLLQDVDPTVFYALELLKRALEIHIGPRLLEVTSQFEANPIKSAVAECASHNPEPYLTQQTFAFPLLTLYRQKPRFTERTMAFRRVETEAELAYVLPSLAADEAERVLPILQAVAALIDVKIQKGSDPGYTPTGGVAGACIWGEDFTGIEQIDVLDATFGGYTPTEELFFPAVVLKLRIRELEKFVMEDFAPYEGATFGIALRAADETVTDLITEGATYPAPTVVSISPTSGTKAGAASVTIAGTGFRPGTPTRVLIGGAECFSVVVLSSTLVQAVTAPHDAYPSFAADVVVIANDGTGQLTAGYTYTTP